MRHIKSDPPVRYLSMSIPLLKISVATIRANGRFYIPSTSSVYPVQRLSRFLSLSFLFLRNSLVNCLTLCLLLQKIRTVLKLCSRSLLSTSGIFVVHCTTKACWMIFQVACWWRYLFPGDVIFFLPMLNDVVAKSRFCLLAGGNLVDDKHDVVAVHVEHHQ